jgi:hypothetical protein
VAVGADHLTFLDLVKLHRDLAIIKKRDVTPLLSPHVIELQHVRIPLVTPPTVHATNGHLDRVDEILTLPVALLIPPRMVVSPNLRLLAPELLATGAAPQISRSGVVLMLHQREDTTPYLLSRGTAVWAVWSILPEVGADDFVWGVGRSSLLDIEVRREVGREVRHQAVRLKK